MRHVLTFITGLVFGTGIAVSGMMNPAKVINFFDITGSWDPSLAFVMGGAVVVAFLGYSLVLRRARPVYDPDFKIPSNPAIDARLLLGSGVFGIGWGIAGFCPGGALPALGTANVNVVIFVAALIAGILVTRGLTPRLSPTAKRTS
ncbi:MAG: DUF6691 family protein [Roseovarius sp.]